MVASLPVVRSIRSLPQRSGFASRCQDTWRGLETLEPRLLLSASSTLFDVGASSWLGGTATNDAVRGAVIQSDGTVVLAANISNAAPGDMAPVLLGNATGSSSGSIIRLSSDGTEVLSVTRLANMVLDLSSDAAGNLYVAMAGEGLAKLNPDADQLLWSKDTITLNMNNVQRVDASPGGYVAVLGGGAIDSGSNLGGDMRIFDTDGVQIGGFTTGRWTNDIALHEDSQTLIHVGFRNATDSASGLPVQIAYYEGRDFNGVVKYTGYDWSGDQNSPRYLNSPTNNMADTRGYRATIGDDGLLYIAFESAGGNYMFRYDPFDINTPASGLAGGDRWHNIFNITAAHITWFGRYDPATGALLAGNAMGTVTNDNATNTMSIGTGNIAADAEGRLYITGSSAWGLPIATHPQYNHNPDRPGFNPGTNNNYLGGAYLVVMDPTMTFREYTTALTQGQSRAIAVRAIDEADRHIVWGGGSSSQLYTVNAIQEARVAGNDGWFAVINGSSGDPLNSAPTAQIAATQVATPAPGQVTLELSAALSFDPDDDDLTYTWVFADGTSAEGMTVEKTFNLFAQSRVTLIVRDGRGGWSTDSTIIGPPNARFSIDTLAGEAPLDLVFNASGTTTPDGDLSSLTFSWDFGNGDTAEGMIVEHRYETGGVFEVTLTVTDSLGGVGIWRETIGVAARDGYSLRLDFGSASSVVQTGFVGLSMDDGLYDPERGYGYEWVGDDFRSGSNRHAVTYFGRDLYNSWHQFSKYPGGPDEIGRFLIDLPDGEYTVLLRFGHNDNPTFPGIVINGERVASNVSHGPTGRGVLQFDKIKVEDGRMVLEFIPPYWFISGIEVFDTGPALQRDATGSFRVDPVSGENPLRVQFTATGFDDSNLTYSWDFGDGNFGSGPVVEHTYNQVGEYEVTLTVTGGSGSTVVSFGGDLVPSNRSIPALIVDRAIDANGNGLEEDSRRYAPFGTTAGGFLAAGNANVPNARIYGGIESIHIGASSVSGTFPTGQITNDGAQDYLNIRDQRAGSELQHRAAFLFIKDEFLNGAHAQRVFFDGDSEMSATFLRWENTGVARWMVQDGDSFFVSEATFSGSTTSTINPNDTAWALYVPDTSVVGGMNFDQDAALFEYRSFTDIRALGFLMEQDGLVGGNGRIWYHFAGFSATAQTAPVAATVTVVAPTPRVWAEVVDEVASEQDLSPASFLISRSGPTNDAITVAFEIGGTAGLSDYTLTSPDGILGDGFVVIPAGSSSVTLLVTPIDDNFREPTETVTLTLIRTDDYFVEPPQNPTYTVFIEDFEEPFVRFGGDYVSSNQLLRSSNPTVTVADFSGNGEADDSRVSYAFSLTNPLSPNLGPAYNGDSAVFYGGAIGTAIGITSNAFQTRSVTNNADNDRVSLRMQPTAGTTDAELHTIWLWEEAGFLLDDGPVRLGGNSRIELSLNRWERMGTGRWVLGDGEHLYVSEQTFTGGGLKVFEGQALADSMWAIFTPTADNINFDEDGAVFDVAVDMIDATIVGFLSDKDFNGDVGRHWLEFNRFVVYEGDNRGPQVEAVIRDGNVGRPDQFNTLDVVFSKDVIDSIHAEVLTVLNQSTGDAVDLAGVSFSYDQSSRTATWDLTALALGPAFYELVLDSQLIADGIGNQLDGNEDGRNGGDFVISDLLVALPGDADLDGVVDDADLALVQANLGQAGRGWGDGHFGDSGRVSLFDAYLLFKSYGQTIQPAAAAVSEPVEEPAVVAVSVQEDSPTTGLESLLPEALAVTAAAATSDPAEEPAVMAVTVQEDSPTTGSESLSAEQPVASGAVLKFAVVTEAEAAWAGGGSTSSTLLSLWDDENEEDSV